MTSTICIFVCFLKLIILTCTSEPLYQAPIYWCVLLLCCLILRNVVNNFVHWSHAYGFSPVCVRKWFCNADFSEQRFSHTWHTYSRLRRWTFLLCLFKLDICVKALPHSSHTCERTPSWTVVLCTFISNLVRKSFLQMSHAYNFSALCLNKCFRNSAYQAKCLPHTSHVYGRISWWADRVCLFKLHGSVNDLSHWSHANGFVRQCVNICILICEYVV